MNDCGSVEASDSPAHDKASDLITTSNLSVPSKWPKWLFPYAIVSVSHKRILDALKARCLNGEQPDAVSAFCLTPEEAGDQHENGNGLSFSVFGFSPFGGSDTPTIHASLGGCVDRIMATSAFAYLREVMLSPEGCSVIVATEFAEMASSVLSALGIDPLSVFAFTELRNVKEEAAFHSAFRG